ncbi:olfactory receptor 11L1-like [Bombina bombina]|uniref:olfactory receptor 11L1-like n=1 Tax=Bombina bombina TaxID=8345 RepID=UPI00235AD258|nr:olfactory receptor 11L1-like [Bombina bombina]
MEAQNQTIVTEILLLGFQQLDCFRIPIFLMFLIIYCLTLVANVMIITLVTLSQHLHSPMYFFLSHLLLSDILLTTNIVPNMLKVILRQGSTIPLSGCITQVHFFGTSLAAECLLLTVMSYDRYLAVCKPLHYSTIMNYNLQLKLVIGYWSISSLISIIAAFLISQLHFCHSNMINHFFCDLAPLLELSCSDTFAIDLDNSLQATPLTIFPIVFISATYVRIFKSILKIQSTIGIQKAFSTCTSHLTVVCIFYGTLFTLYVVPSKGQLLKVNKILSLMYTVVTPLFNPLIYSIYEIKTALRKYVKKIS